jgi:hypothetical protein
MKIFSMPEKDEEYSETNCPLGGLRLEPRAVSPNQSGVTTSPLDGVKSILIQVKYFKYLN